MTSFGTPPVSYSCPERPLWPARFVPAAFPASEIITDFNNVELERGGIAVISYTRNKFFFSSYTVNPSIT